MLPDFTPSAASRSLPRAALWKRSTLTLPPVFAATSSPKRMAVREAEWAGGYRLAKRRVISGRLGLPAPHAHQPGGARCAGGSSRPQERAAVDRGSRGAVRCHGSLPWPSWSRCDRESRAKRLRICRKEGRRQEVLGRGGLDTRRHGRTHRIAGSRRRPDCIPATDRLDWHRPPLSAVREGRKGCVRLILAVVGALSVFLSGGVSAQDYPARPIPARRLRRGRLDGHRDADRRRAYGEDARAADRHREPGRRQRRGRDERGQQRQAGRLHARR